MKPQVFVSILLLAGASSAFAEEPRLWLTQADRLEHQSDEDRIVWDLQGFYGGDYQKFWWKLEGQDGGDAENELELLYSRAVTPYFDLQVGARLVDSDGSENIGFVVGLQGLAAFNVEVDAAAFVTDHGDVALQAEFERDILLTQRWVLQPRIEVEWWLSDQPDLGIENGDASSAVDLRLRYEFKRKFAPYIGLSWQDASNGTSSTSVVGGLRFWF